MNNNNLAKLDRQHALRMKLCKESGYIENAVRPLHVAFTRANYGNIDCAILSWQGSPSLTRTFVVLGGCADDCYVVSTGHKNFKYRSRKAYELGAEVFRFLMAEGYLKPSDFEPGKNPHPAPINTDDPEIKKIIQKYYVRG